MSFQQVEQQQDEEPWITLAYHSVDSGPPLPSPPLPSPPLPSPSSLTCLLPSPPLPFLTHLSPPLPSPPLPHPPVPSPPQMKQRLSDRCCLPLRGIKA